MSGGCGQPRSSKDNSKEHKTALCSRRERVNTRKTQLLGILQRTWVSAANHQEGRVETEITASVVTWTCSHILAGLCENDVPKCPKIEMLQTLGKGKTAESHHAKCRPCPLQREHGHCSAGSSSRAKQSHQTTLPLPLSSSFPRLSCRAATPSAGWAPSWPSVPLNPPCPCSHPSPRVSGISQDCWTMSIIPSEQLTFVSLCCLHFGDKENCPARNFMPQWYLCCQSSWAVLWAVWNPKTLCVQWVGDWTHFSFRKGFFPPFFFFCPAGKKNPTKQQNKVSLLKLNHNSAFSVVFQVGDNSWSYSHPVALLRY